MNWPLGLPLKVAWSSEARAQDTEGRIPSPPSNSGASRILHSWSSYPGWLNTHLCLNRRIAPCPHRELTMVLSGDAEMASTDASVKNMAWTLGIISLRRITCMAKWIIMRDWNHERLKSLIYFQEYSRKIGMFQNIKKVALSSETAPCYSHTPLSGAARIEIHFSDTDIFLWKWKLYVLYGFGKNESLSDVNLWLPAFYFQISLLHIPFYSLNMAK